ncbi:MAG TPA: hypothetical protein VFD92_10380 [Candidatus Binatia bacterium]|nr:hypothetical protein [Candidatus Binatia bacterium]
MRSAAARGRDIRAIRRALVVAVAAAVAAIAVAAPARGQQPPEPEFHFAVNYVYAAQLGFGGYSVGGLNVHLYSLPIGLKFDDVIADWALRLEIPIQYGDYDFHGTVEDVRVSGTSHTIAIAPKAKLEIPVVPRLWRVSLIGGWGFGTSFDSSARAVQGDERTPVELDDTSFYTYQAGASSLLQREVGGFTFGLGNSFVYAGNATLDGDPSVEGYGALSTGVEAKHALGFRVWSLVPDASLFFIHDYFTPSLQFTRTARSNLEVDNLFEIGVTFGSETPIEVPFLEDLRLGGSYQFGNGLDAVRLNFGFPF